MKIGFFNRTTADRSLIFQDVAAKRRLIPVMVEKDFWVSWVLAVLFAHPEYGNELVFKGGTSLSKVFNVIRRFSEDIDISVNPGFLGIDEKSIELANTRNKRAAWMEEMEARCVDFVRLRFLPELERIAVDALGASREGAWMKFEVDPATHSPTILFHYPGSQFGGFEYLRQFIKIEFGALTDQRPVAVHSLSSWVSEEYSSLFSDFRCEVVAMELERTFWEKATILHAEYHRDSQKPIRDRFSRHYSDMAALALHPISEQALLKLDLLDRVVQWKSKFFAAKWARFDEAVAGTFRIVPPAFRVSELKRDYRAMGDMFMGDPPSFENILIDLTALEKKING